MLLIQSLTPAVIDHTISLYIYIQVHGVTPLVSGVRYGLFFMQFDRNLGCEFVMPPAREAGVRENQPDSIGELVYHLG